MASAIKHTFKEAAIALIRGSWANRIARFCSFLAGADGIDVMLREHPSPNAPNIIRLNAAVAAPRLYQAMKDIGIQFGYSENAAASTETMADNSSETGSPAMLTNTWTADPDGESPKDLEVQVFTRFTKTGSIHYAFYRNLTFTTGGRLKSISAELGFVRIGA